MSREGRWSLIIEHCRSREQVSVDEMVGLLGVSPATVRRDFQELEDLGIIRRFHGGARMDAAQGEDSSERIKQEINAAEKSIIALCAARLVHDNQMIFIDSGSTVAAMVPLITAKNVIVVTNSTTVLPGLIKRHMHAVMLGGTLSGGLECTYGRETLRQMDEFYFDLAFLGVNGIHEGVGLIASREVTAAVKAKAIERSRKAYVLADHTKFGRLSLSQFATLDEATIVTDRKPDFDLSLIRYILPNDGGNVRS